MAGRSRLRRARTGVVNRSHPEAQHVRTQGRVFVFVLATLDDGPRVHHIAQRFAHLVSLHPHSAPVLQNILTHSHTLNELAQPETLLVFHLFTHLHVRILSQTSSNPNSNTQTSMYEWKGHLFVKGEAVCQHSLVGGRATGCCSSEERTLKPAAMLVTSLHAINIGLGFHLTQPPASFTERRITILNKRMVM